MCITSSMTHSLEDFTHKNGRPRSNPEKKRSVGFILPCYRSPWSIPWAPCTADDTSGLWSGIPHDGLGWLSGPGHPPSHLWGPCPRSMKGPRADSSLDPTSKQSPSYSRVDDVCCMLLMRGAGVWNDGHRCLQMVPSENSCKFGGHDRQTWGKQKWIAKGMWSSSMLWFICSVSHYRGIVDPWSGVSVLSHAARWGYGAPIKGLYEWVTGVT